MFKQLQHQSCVWLTVICFSHSGKILPVYGDELNALVSQPVQATTLAGHQQDVFGLCFSPDGKTLASASPDETVKVWDVADGRLRLDLQTRSEPTADDQLTPLPLSFRLAQTLVAHTKDAFRKKNFAYRAVFSPNGKILASAYRDGRIILWHVASGRQTDVLEGHSDAVVALAFSPDSHTLASGSYDGTVIIWDLTVPAKQKVIEQNATIHCIAVSHDGRALAVGISGGLVRLWDLDQARQLALLKNDRTWISSVAFSPNDRLLVVTGPDALLRLWDVKSVTVQRDFKRPFNLARPISNLRIMVRKLPPERQRLDFDPVVHAASFSPDGKMLASASSGSFEIWDVSTGEVLSMFIHDRATPGFFRSVAFSPDGKKLATATPLRIFDLATLLPRLRAGK